MSRKKKLEQFAELDRFENVLQCTDPQSSQAIRYDGEVVETRGHWRDGIFKNNNPLVTELACGKGEYTVALAQRDPGKNFIGIDIKGNRMHRGAKNSLALGLGNARFLRIRIEWLTHHFAPGEVDEIWITFPDPFLKKSKANRRLTSPGFQKMYRNILSPTGTVHLKTDSPELYEFTLETLMSTPGVSIIAQSEDIDRDGLNEGILSIQTHYEKLHRASGISIRYISWIYHAGVELLN
ncbi:MAG TPA: tRNA (guanosine(46)-N7)-methyltransferase TrmB [Saprospiraceae bacterium]|nr:tRNA (guanosine(46)-N7)-methyltransferase TrmB [Saprospiraceae bacterium]HNT21843.1 tRNA (guanosine(46)-N7)-methyltransferase TrmB [Saprospiraceae bacterium]